MHGVNWDILAKEIPSKEKTQIKNYYQNYKQRLELDQIELPATAKHPKASRVKGPSDPSSRASTPSRARAARQGSDGVDAQVAVRASCAVLAALCCAALCCAVLRCAMLMCPQKTCLQWLIAKAVTAWTLR